MARFLGSGCVLKSPRTIRSYTVAEAPQWQGSDHGLRPPAHIIGVGGFGVTYRVVDDRGAAFAMKEYFPRDHAVRGADGRIVPKRSEDGFSRKIFEEGLRRFVAEGHLLSSFVHRNVSRVVDSFDDNATSYQLMKLVEGREILGESDTGAARIERRVTLEDFLRELEGPENATPIDLPLLEPVLQQLLAAVEYIHTEGTRKAQEITGAPVRALLHRDIKPQNILIEAPAGMTDAPAAEVLRHPETVVTLIDFGSARLFRDAQDDDVSRSIGVVTEGYAPPELKDNQVEQQGPHSDIYSVAAVIWRAFVGRKPTTAQLANGAKLAELVLPIRGPDGVHPRAPKAFLQAVDRALNAAVGLRPQSVAQWRQELWGGKPVRKQAVRQGDGVRTASPRPVALAVSLMAAAGVAVALFWFNAGSAARNIETQSGLAFEDAQKAATLAGDVANRAAQASKDAADLYGPAIAKATDGRERYARFQTFEPLQKIYHDKDSGSIDMGDKWVTFTWPTGATLSMWCFKRGAPGVEPESIFDVANYTVDGDKGWSCGAAHSHVMQREFTEEKNPWHVEGAGFNYDGEVDTTAQKASGLGEIRFGDHRLTGRFTAVGADYDVLGLMTSVGGVTRVGRFRLSMTPNPPTALDWVGQEYDDAKKVTFEGHTNADQQVGRFQGSDGEHLGVLSSRGLALGRIDRAPPYGSTIYGSAGDGQDQGWGHLDTTQAVYSGQVINGKPDGCGIWDQGGKKEVGFYVAGTKRDGPLPDSCRRLHYQSPVDMAALIRSNAAEAPK